MADSKAPVDCFPHLGQVLVKTKCFDEWNIVGYSFDVSYASEVIPSAGLMISDQLGG